MAERTETRSIFLEPLTHEAYQAVRTRSVADQGAVEYHFDWIERLEKEDYPTTYHEERAEEIEARIGAARKYLMAITGEQLPLRPMDWPWSLPKGLS